MTATLRCLRLVTLTSAHWLLLSGCFGTPAAFMKQDEAAQAVIPIKKTVESGVTTGIIDPQALYPQILSADDASLAGSAATFPPGALAVSTQISIQEGVPIATPALAGSLSISNGFQTTAAPVAVTADQNLDAAKPFTIAIPLPATTTSLFSLSDPFENLVVAYVVKVSATGETRTGVMPRAALIINGNRVSFESYYFGVYQAALTAEKVREERKTESNVITVQTKAEQKSLPPMAITGRSPFVVKEGDTVTVRGVNLRPTIRLAMNGKSVSSLNLASDASLSFIAPADTSVGLVTLTAEQEGTTQNVSLVFDGKGTIPVISEDKSKICSDVQFYDVNGVLQTGTRNCNAVAVADCVNDGEVGCKTTVGFKAAMMANVTAANIATGITIAGVAGTYSGSAPANCTANGEVGCVTTSTYKAADLTNLVAGNVKNGITLAGVAGTYPSLATPLAGATGTSDLTSMAASTPAGSYEFFDSAGTRYTGSISDAGTVTPASSNQAFSASLYRQFTVEGDADLVAANIKSGVTLFGVAGTAAPSPADCASDGGVGCVTTASYKAAKMANFSAANITSGITIAGVAGTGAGESHVNCTNDGALGCVTTVSYPAADAAMAMAANIKSGITIAGVTGTLTPESHTSCSTDGQTGCVTTASYKAANTAMATPGNIKNGVSIAGVTGAYPSATYPLPGATGTPDLDAATFQMKLKSPSSFEWFDSSGNLYTQAGDPDIMGMNIVGGVDIFGEVGSIPNCNADGMTGCMTTAIYRAADTLAFDSWDVRRGRVVAGVTGQLAFYRNAIGSWNTTTTPATSATDEVWDTVDDYGTGSFASMLPTNPSPLSMGWDIATSASNWVSSGTGQRDLLTGLVWSMGNGSTQIWNNALSYCHSKTDGVAAGTWRLPTQKELMQAYTNGIMSVMAPLSINTGTVYWSATTVGLSTSNAWAVKLPTGETTSGTNKSSTAGVICVRQGP